MQLFPPPPDAKAFLTSFTSSSSLQFRVTLESSQMESQAATWITTSVFDSSVHSWEVAFLVQFFLQNCGTPLRVPHDFWVGKISWGRCFISSLLPLFLFSFFLFFVKFPHFESHFYAHAMLRKSTLILITDSKEKMSWLFLKATYLTLYNAKGINEAHTKWAFKRTDVKPQHWNMNTIGHFLTMPPW